MQMSYFKSKYKNISCINLVKACDWVDINTQLTNDTMLTTTK